MKRKFLQLALSLLLTLGGSFLVGLFIHRTGFWYDSLIKSPLTPPDYVFGIVWTLLYLMMGVSFWGVWCFSRDPKIRRASILAFFLQSALNFTWGFSFFEMHALLLSFIHILLLIGALILTMILFWKSCRWASILLWPYFLWTLFAAYLSYALWVLNS